MQGLPARPICNRSACIPACPLCRTPCHAPPDGSPGSCLAVARDIRRCGDATRATTQLGVCLCLCSEILPVWLTLWDAMLSPAVSTGSSSSSHANKPGINKLATLKLLLQLRVLCCQPTCNSGFH